MHLDAFGKNSKKKGQEKNPQIPRKTVKFQEKAPYTRFSNSKPCLLLTKSQLIFLLSAKGGVGKKI